MFGSIKMKYEPERAHFLNNKKVKAEHRHVQREHSPHHGSHSHGRASVPWPRRRPHPWQIDAENSLDEEGLMNNSSNRSAFDSDANHDSGVLRQSLYVLSSGIQRVHPNRERTGVY